jgi:CRISPR-associated exonuclease Cas4
MSKGRQPFDWSVLRPDAGTVRPATAPPVPGVARLAEGPDRPAARPDAPSFPLRVNDLKQFAYCPRIVFYQHVMPVDRKATFKMEHGKAVEARIAQLEQRRTLHRYGLGDGSRRFQLWLNSERLGLSGRLDLLIQTAREAVPVDFKDTNAPVQRNHHLQLCAYALLVEDALSVPVRRAFIYRVPQDDAVELAMTPELRARTLRDLDAIRTMIADERTPEATEVRARCEDCEYRNYCGDVF